MAGRVTLDQQVRVSIIGSQLIGSECGTWTMGYTSNDTQPDAHVIEGITIVPDDRTVAIQVMRRSGVQEQQ